MNSHTTARSGVQRAWLALNGVDDPDGTLDFDSHTFQTSNRDNDQHHGRREALSQQPTSPALARTDSEIDPLLQFPSPPGSHMAAVTSTSATASDPIATSSSPPRPLSSSVVDPATVPVRTSSSHAINGDKATSPKQRTVKQHRSMASVPEESKASRHYPEVDERHWLGQSKGKKERESVMGSSPGAARYEQPASIGGSTAVGDDRERDRDKGIGLQGVGADLISGQNWGWSTEKENILKGPFEYLESNPGKDIRSQLINAFNAWLQVPSSSLAIISGVVTMLHTASLLVDDVEDSSQLRRGVPVAHSIFGTAQTINSANYVYFCALQELLKLNNPEAVRIFTEELLNLHRGQGMDLFWRDTLTCPTEDDYLEMVGNKTGGLFRLAIKLMCAESPTHHFNPSDDPTTRQTDYVPLVNTVGLLFQILDDYKNLSDTTYHSNKGLAEDLTEGKFSFPIIHAIRADPSNLVLINILKQKTKDDEVKRYAIGYMERAGSFAYTRRILRGLTKKALQLVDEVDDGRGKADGIRSVLERLRVERHARASQSA